MRSGPSVWTRARRLETVHGRGSAPEVAALAWDPGILTEELAAEAEGLAARCLAAGATTLSELAAVSAAETGIDPSLVVAEVARRLAGGH